jgi:glycosyltransferase involved in cell wall biosynthesis
MKKTILYVTIEPIEYRRRILNQIETARQAGFEVEIFSLGEKGKDYEESIDRLNVNKITVPLDKGPLKFIIFNLKLFFKFFLKKYDIIHFRGIWVIPAVILRQLFNKSILIYDANEYFAGHQIFESRPIRKHIWLFAERISIPFIETLITVSDPLVQFYKKRYPHLKNIMVIRNLPSVRLASGHTIKQNIFKGEGTILIFHGYFLPGRALENLMRAMYLIKDEPVKLILVGEGPLKPKLNRISKDLGIEEMIIFHDLVSNDNLINFISQADIGISLIEADCINRTHALPNKFFECIMAGIPILASNIPTLELYMDKYQVGMVTDPADPAQIAKSLKSMIENPEQLREWKNNCFKAARILNWEKESQKLSSIYESFKLESSKQND